MPENLASSLRRVTLIVAAALTLLPAVMLPLRGDYTQMNLVSNSSATPANFTDPNLINPWGVVSNGGSPLWVSNQGTGLSTLYDLSTTPPGGIVSLVVTIPGGNPTGVVANATGFNVNGSPAAFIFGTLGGKIAGWNGSPLTSAVTEASVAGAVFTGLAQASNATSTFLYAADFKNNKIDVFDSSYVQQTTGFAFVDPNLPTGYAPYNIQAINNKLYVEYDPVGSNGLPVVGPGNGIVDVFDSSGSFLQRLVSNGGALDDPWGIALAPPSFGQFGGDILVGNFGNGWINAFNASTGAFIGTLDLANGTPFAEPALWTLDFGIGGSGGTPGVLYFTSGLTLSQTGGLLGSLEPTIPEPATLTLLVSGLIGLLGLRRYKR